MRPVRRPRYLTHERRRFIKFGIVGTSGLFVNLGFVWVGHRIIFAHFDPNTLKAASSALGIIISVFTNFLINNAWTWGDRKKGKRKRDFIIRLLRYYLAGSLAIGIQFGTATALSIGFGKDIYVAQIIGILCGMAVNFFVNNFWTFRDRSPHVEGHGTPSPAGADECLSPRPDETP